MNTIMQFLESSFDWIWATPLWAGALVLIVLLVQALTGRWLSAKGRYFLSFLVVLRLVWPGWITSPFSIERLTIMPIEERIGHSRGSPLLEATPAQLELDTRRGFPSWKRALCLAWLGVAALLLAVALYRRQRLALWISRQSIERDPRLMRLLDEARERMGVRRPVRLIRTDECTAPALWGIYRPAALIPDAFAREPDDRKVLWVFMHEMAHQKRGDLAWNWLLLTLKSLHWFNPLIWIAFRRLVHDREVLCDAMVLKRLQPSEHHCYGETLIDLLRNFRPAKASVALAESLTNRSLVKRRVQMIAKFNSKGIWAVFASVILIVTVCFLTFTRAGQQANTDTKTDTKGAGPGLTG